MKERDEAIICKNCGNQFRLRYCNNCGQKADTNRITWHEVLHHLPHAVFHVDSGFFYTIKELATRPGHMIREYISGRRKNHFSPFLMFILLAGLCSYLYVHFHLQTVLASIRLDTLEAQNATLAHKYFAFRTVFFCLVCSAGDVLFFREKGYTFPEMIVVNTFIFCGVSLIQILFVPVLLLRSTIVPGFLIVPSVIAYLVITRLQFFNAAGNKKLMAKIVVVVLLYALLIIVLGQGIIKPFFGS